MTPGALDDLKDRNSCIDIAGRWVSLRRMGDHQVGPCPLCSKDGGSKRATRFEVWPDRFVCAVCHEGGDVINLVMKREGLDFAAAIAWLGGTQPVDPAKEKEREADRKAKREADAKASAEFRERARGTAFETWKRAADSPTLAPIADYLVKRGLGDLPLDGMRLRCQSRMPYWADGTKGSDAVHRGPAMLAPIMRGGKFSGLHITYLDPAQPKGKLKIADAEGGEMPAKKVRGVKRGGHIELVAAVADSSRPRRLIIGEGIEKVGAVWCAHQRVGRPVFDTAFWTSVDLGNLGGKAVASVKHPTEHNEAGRPRNVPGPVPDMSEPGIEIPASVEELIILGDSTSDMFETQCAVARAASRFARPGLDIRVAWSPAGEDFDETLQRDGGAAAILAIIDAAVLPVAPALSAPAAAPARTRAPRARQHQTGAGNAGAPVGLPVADTGQDGADPPADPADAALGPAPPPAAPLRDISRKKTDKPSRPGWWRRSADRGKWGGGLPPVIEAELNRTLAFYPMTDLGNAERFVARNRNRLRYCPALPSKWVYWDGARWAHDGADAKVKKAEHETVRAIQQEADAVDAMAAALLASVGGKVRKLKKPDKDKLKYYAGLAKVLRAFGRDSEESRRLSPINKRAEADLYISISQLDADQFALNVANGTLVIRRFWPADDTGREGWYRVNEHIYFKPHDPNDLITKVSPAEFDPDAECPDYDKFFARVQPPAEMRRHLHQCGGYSLTGDTSEHLMWFNWGKGRNGKSTLLNAWAHVAGDYSATINVESFLDQGTSKSGGQPTPDLAALAGVRLVRTSEPEEGAKLAEALIKLATGGEPMSVRHLNREFFPMLPHFKLKMSGNHRPKIRGTDEGIWARMRLVRWTVFIPKDERDRALGDKLQAEASGILNRLLEGLVDWLKHGMTLPKDIEDATAEYRRDSDVLGRFLEACVKSKEGARIQSSSLHALFCAWCKANGEREWTATGFGRAMSERGFQRRHSDVNYWLNIEAIKSVNDFVDHEGRPLPMKPDGNDVARPADQSDARPTPVRRFQKAEDDDEIPI